MEITIKWTVDSKSDEEAKKKVEALLKDSHGTLLPPLPDWDPEELRNEIQDLKLENDRLKQRDELMLKFISDLYDQLSDKDSLIMRSELIRTMVNLRKQLEAL